MLAVALGSASIGAWGEGTTLLFLFSLSGALEGFALGRTQREIRSLFREAPKFATVLDERGQEREVQVEKLRPGMRLLVKPGAQFPVDAEIVKGQTASDESNLTGEVTPVAKAIGDTVLAGTINLWGAVEVLVLRPVAESSLQKIIHLDQGSPAAESPGAAVHRPVRHVSTPTACWGCRSSCSSSGGWASARRRLRRRASGTARFTTP